MPKLSFWKVLLAVLVLALVVLFLLRENPDLEPFTYIDKASLSDPSTPPSCPDCGTGMVLRYRHKDGEPFWGCKGYPRCHGTRSWGGLKFADFKWRYEELHPDASPIDPFEEYLAQIGVPDSLGIHCPLCFSLMDEIEGGGRYWRWRCSRYPKCKGEFEYLDTSWDER